MSLRKTDLKCATDRPEARGKFLFANGEKLSICGVTYGTFRPDEHGNDFNPSTVAGDFEKMAAHGINAVRTYTVPPLWFLELAERHGLKVMVGIPWEQHVTFLDDPARLRSIQNRLRDAVSSCAGHPAILCFSVGNEIPSSIVRWYGAERIENFLEQLCRIVKATDPGALVTYVNFPTTEYLDLPFLDLVCFNVYLECTEKWERYLARLQNLAGERPLMLAEIGLDSRRNGEQAQAHALDWLTASALRAGSAGTFIFGWTDEWHRGGFDVEDWDFGLTRRDRTGKLALERVRRIFAEGPYPTDREWPLVSVVVCTYNGHRTLRDCLQGLTKLRYPNFEVIVVDDGSSPPMAALAAPYGFNVIRTANQGLSTARNVGMNAAKGEIVAYLDDDAYPDPDWLTYLADVFLTRDYVGIGGPNLAPPNSGRVADCVANAPGGPTHVLLSDEVAEHIPGCNMAFRKSALQAAGGFDSRFRVAGDDVDICWALQAHGGVLGFHPAAVVWHYRRNSMRAYWKQQKGYGHAESLLKGKWPEKYNAADHVSWSGRIYSKGNTKTLGQSNRIYQGTWGESPFQSLYQTGAHPVFSVLAMPEWYLVVLILGLGAASAWDYQWFWPIFFAFALAGALPIVQAWKRARRATFATPPRNSAEALGLCLLTAFLHLVQPVARLWGRIQHGLAPWRTHATGFSMPRLKHHQLWSETWYASSHWLEQAERTMRGSQAVTNRGGHFDRWDLEVRGGLSGSARLLMAIEEHGSGRQLIRFRCWPRPTPVVSWLCVFLAAGAIYAGLNHAVPTMLCWGGLAFVLGFQLVQQCGAAMSVMEESLRGVEEVQATGTPHPRRLRQTGPLAVANGPAAVPSQKSGRPRG